MPYPRLNPFSHPFVSFCFNFYFDKISDSCKSCKNCTKCSHIPFPQIPQMLIFLLHLFYPSLLLPLSPSTHTHAHTHIHLIHFLLHTSESILKQGHWFFSKPSTTVKIRNQTPIRYYYILYRLCSDSADVPVSWVANAFRCHVSLVSFNLEHFFSFPLSSMTFTFLKSTGQLFCRTSVNLDLSSISLCLDAGYVFLAKKKPKKQKPKTY